MSIRPDGFAEVALSFRPLMVWVGLAMFAAPACAEPWSSVFAADRDTAVFLGTDGTLFRAPMNLEGREVLWAGDRDQPVVRFAVSPVGGRVAWITRGFDRDTTRLWVPGPKGAQQKLRYFALVPSQRGVHHVEPGVPSIADAQARGGRLVQTGASKKLRSANTLAWTADGLSVVLGYDGGIVRLDPVTREGAATTDAVAVELEALAPSPMFLVTALMAEPLEASPAVTQLDLDQILRGAIPHLVVRDGRRLDPIVPPARRLEIMGPTATGWKMRMAPEWAGSEIRAAGSTAVWWASRNVVYALRAVDLVAEEVLKTGDDVLWLGYDGAQGRLLGAAGRQVWAMPESGGVAAPVLETTASIRRVLGSRTGASVAVLAGDSMLVWSPATGAVRRFNSRGYEPCALYESPDGRLVVQANCGPALPRQLARADVTSRRLIPIETPNLREGRFQAAGRGAWILLYDPAPKPPRRLHAYDVAQDRWRTVDNPGIAAWEPLR